MDFVFIFVSIGFELSQIVIYETFPIIGYNLVTLFLCRLIILYMIIDNGIILKKKKNVRKCHFGLYNYSAHPSYHSHKENITVYHRTPF